MKAAPLILLGVLLAPALSLAAPVTFQELEESLTCQCGCGLTVHSCNHLQCGSAIPLRQEIREQMALNKTKEQILAHFSEKYGEKILSSPTTTGFNITAWVTPFILVFLGAVFVGLALSRWGRRGAPPGAGPTKKATAAPGEYQEILDRELEHFSD